MNNAEILKTLKQRAKQEAQKKYSDEALTKYVVFTVGEIAYALDADKVKEITFNNELYYVPFLPPYVRGYANRHGAPFTVYDVQLLFERGPLDSTTLLVLNLPGDQVGLLISDVNEIIKLPTEAVHPLASSDDTARYFSSSIEVQGKEVFVLNIDTLVERLERDVERA